MALDSKNKEDLDLRLHVKDVSWGKNLTKAEQRLLKFTAAANRVFKMMALQATIAGVAFAALGKSIIGINTEFEALRFKLGVLFKDMQKGRDVFAEVLEFAKIAPVSAQEVVRSVVLLEAFGLRWKTVLQDVGDLAAGAQKPMEQVAEAFGRLQAGLTGRAFLSFARMGIAIQDLKDAGLEFDAAGGLIDKSVQGIDKAIKAVQGVIQAKFPNMMEQMAVTAKTMFENVGDFWDQFRDIIGQQLFEQIKDDLRKILAFFDVWMKSPQFTEFADRVGKGFKDVYNFLTKDFGPDVVAMFRRIGQSEAFKILKDLFLAAATNVDKILIVFALTKALEIAIKLRGVLMASGLISATGGLVAGLSGLAHKGVGAAAFSMAGGGFAGGAAATKFGSMAAGLVPVVAGVVAALVALGGFYWLVQRMGIKAGEPGARQTGPILRGGVAGPSAALSSRQGSLELQTVQQLRIEFEKLRQMKAGDGDDALKFILSPKLPFELNAELQKELEALGTLREFFDTTVGRRARGTFRGRRPGLNEINAPEGRVPFRGGFIDTSTGKIDGQGRSALDVFDPFPQQLTIDQMEEQFELAEGMRARNIDREVSLEERRAAAIMTIVNKTNKEQMVAAQFAMNTMMRMTNIFAEFRKAKLSDIGKIAKIAILDELGAFLSAQATAMAVLAIRSVGEGLLYRDPAKFAAAAKFAAGATLAGAGATIAINAAAGARESFADALDPGGAEERRKLESATLGGNFSGRRIGGTVRAENLSVTISPVITIQGETILVGNLGIEELKESIGQAAVESVQDAIETGQINVGLAATAG